MKQTHNIKLAEKLSPISKKLEKINKTTKDSSEREKKSISEDQTPQLVLENTGNNIEPGLMHDISLEKTLSNMKKQKGFFQKEERANGDFF